MNACTQKTPLRSHDAKVKETQITGQNRSRTKTCVEFSKDSYALHGDEQRSARWTMFLVRVSGGGGVTPHATCRRNDDAKTVSATLVAPSTTAAKWGPVGFTVLSPESVAVARSVAGPIAGVSIFIERNRPFVTWAYEVIRKSIGNGRDSKI